MSAYPKMEWGELNHAYLTVFLHTVQEELKLYLARQSAKSGPVSAPESQEQNSNLRESLEHLDQAFADLHSRPAIETLTQMFRLSTFECKVLLLCAGIELDGRFGRDDFDESATLPIQPTFSLALAAFADAHWSAVSPASPLRFWRLINITGTTGITKSPLKIDERILHYLTGVTYLDDRLRDLSEPLYAHTTLAPSQIRLLDKILYACKHPSRQMEMAVIQLTGEEIADQKILAAEASAALGLTLYGIAAHAIPGDRQETAELARIWNREAALNAYAILIDCSSFDMQDKSRIPLITRFIKDLIGLVFVSNGEWMPEINRAKLEINVQKPTQPEQISRWKSSLGKAAEHLNGQLEEVVAQFNLGTAHIDTICLEVTQNNIDQPEIDNRRIDQKIWHACNRLTRLKIDELAQRIEPVAAWDDIILPVAQKQILKEIVAQVKNRNKVYSQWGFAGMGSRGMGISALFSGESGTGKTMASEVLANELALDLYKIDLSQVVNKYIGETEKNLKRIFDAAESSGAILLFDEADALFGKRSDVKDSHDRYSNIEVSYLLQRIEAYRGLAVLTTNMKSSIDDSFLRRIRFIIQFPYPDAAHRAEIWRRAFPPKTPVKDLNVEKLARLNVPGGNIRNIALNAAFIAASAGEPVQMTHIARAARNEYAKLEKTISSNEFTW